MELLIVGAGAIGRWFASTQDADAAFADVDPAAADAAAAACGGRAVGIDADVSAATVCVAVPMTIAAETVATHARKADEAVVDLSGVMTAPVESMRTHAPDREHLSLHPLFAPENAPGRIAAVEDATGPRTAAVIERLEAAGNTVFGTTPDEHDRAMETVQARAHAAILAFAVAADDVDPRFGTPVYEGLVGLVDDLLGGTPRVYADIQDTFDGAEDVAAAARRIADADHDGFESLYRDAGG